MDNRAKTEISNFFDGHRKAGADVSAFLGIIFICLLFSAGFVIFGIGLPGEADSVEIDGKININEASAVSMMRLPGIGISRAESIVTYRQQCGREKAFESADDLTDIRGIGIKTADSVKKYIRFE